MALALFTKMKKIWSKKRFQVSRLLLVFGGEGGGVFVRLCVCKMEIFPWEIVIFCHHTLYLIIVHLLRLCQKSDRQRESRGDLYFSILFILDLFLLSVLLRTK